MHWWEVQSLLPFRSPTTCLISGATMSGKMHFMFRVLKNATGIFEIPPQKMIYCYSQYQKLFDDMEREIPNILFYQGLPAKEQIEEWVEDSAHSILVLDDLMMQVAKSEDTVAIFSITAQKLYCIFSYTKLVRAVQEFPQSFTKLSLRSFISFPKRYQADIVIWSSSVSRTIGIF